MDCLPTIHIAAYHAESGYNNNTPGIGVECYLNQDFALTAGTYFNSIRKQSVYTSVVMQPYNYGNLKLGGMVGLATGYDVSPIVPIGGALLSYVFNEYKLNLLVIPKINNISPFTMEMSVTFNF